MKKVFITIVSLFYAISGYCQSKALYLKNNKETIKFETWDTIYAVKSEGKVVILKDKKGKEFRCELDANGSEYNSSIEIYSGRYHIHGDYKIGVPCHSGIIIMDDKMKLFFKDNAKPCSNHSDHGSHMSHYSSKF